MNIAMKAATIQVGVVMMLVVVTGCARPDWIENMLVTVDVTGTWSGTVGHAGGVVTRHMVGNSPAEITLQQEGPNVTGLVKNLRVFGRGSLPYDSVISGTVNGDVVRLSAGGV